MSAKITLAEAKRLGLERYFTGKPCSRGHVAARATANRKCVACFEEDEQAQRLAEEQQIEHVRNFIWYRRFKRFEARMLQHDDHVFAWRRHCFIKRQHADFDARNAAVAEYVKSIAYMGLSKQRKETEWR